MRLAWANIAHDRVRFLVTVAGITCAVFLMVFQGSILYGFVQAASRLIDSTDADLWITARGVPCFEFPAPLDRRYVEIAHSIPGVLDTSRICTRMVQFRKQDGSNQLVILVGADRSAGARFPLPRVRGASAALQPQSVVIDESNTQLLEVARLPLGVELNQHRASVVGRTSGFSSFLGSPYVFASYADAAQYIQLRPEETMYILVRVAPTAVVAGVRRGLQSRLPNADVWTREEFAHRARLYWITQTGAGGAILMAAILGFCIGIAIVSQTIYATTMENLEEFATLKAIGAGNGHIIAVILIQALICAAVGYVLGIAVTAPAVSALKGSIPWATMPWWLPLAVLPPALGMCALASIFSVRTALSVEPAKVFRA